MESFNNQDELVNKSIQTVQATSTSPNGSVTGTIKGETLDQEEQIIGTIEYQVKCEDGKYFISMNSFLNPAQMNAYEDMQVKVDGDFLELPSNLTAGTNLKDATVNLNAQSEGVEIMNLSILIYERKVEKIESITTPAGTFECSKLVYNIESQMGRDIPIVIKSSGVEWIAKDTGMVRSEQYDEQQNLVSYSVLTEYLP